jgi:hypothetical protein
MSAYRALLRDMGVIESVLALPTAQRVQQRARVAGAIERVKTRMAVLTGQGALAGNEEERFAAMAGDPDRLLNAAPGADFAGVNPLLTMRDLTNGIREDRQDLANYYGLQQVGEDAVSVSDEGALPAPAAEEVPERSLGETIIQGAAEGTLGFPVVVGNALGDLLD